jgi:hypothetical protein
MGCDIHCYKEKQVNGVWVSADEWERNEDGELFVPYQKRFTDRNYNLFGLLSSGVRRKHPYSFAGRGIPFDTSAEVMSNFDYWYSDGHSHSYLYLHELKDLLRFLKGKTIKIEGLMDSAQLKSLNDSIATENPDWSLIYPYCQGTNMPGHEQFSVDAPAPFFLGEGLESLISSFDGIDGDNHRIVFWFDN